MKPIEPTAIAHSRPVGTNVARSIKNAAATPGSAATPQPEPGVLAQAPATAAGTAPPVDSERVMQIRAALREGTYPLMPAELADAMIAADYILLEGRKD